jgi:hypothetical protein
VGYNTGRKGEERKRRIRSKNSGMKDGIKTWK